MGNSLETPDCIQGWSANNLEKMVSIRVKWVNKPDLLESMTGLLVNKMDSSGSS